MGGHSSQQNEVRGEGTSSQTWWESKQGIPDMRELLGWQWPGCCWNMGMGMQETGLGQAARQTSQGFEGSFMAGHSIQCACSLLASPSLKAWAWGPSVPLFAGWPPPAPGVRDPALGRLHTGSWISCPPTAASLPGSLLYPDPPESSRKIRVCRGHIQVLPTDHRGVVPVNTAWPAP